MYKIKLLLLLLICSIGASAQVNWNNYGVQYKISGSDTTYKIVSNTIPVKGLQFYSKAQINAGFNPLLSYGNGLSLVGTTLKADTAILRTVLNSYSKAGTDAKFATIAQLVDYVTKNGVETLTNKTLTSPAINTPTIIGGTINNTTIGSTTPSTGVFTTLSASSSANVPTVTPTSDSTTKAVNTAFLKQHSYSKTQANNLLATKAPLSGSTNYIQNGTSLQASSNFNISGNGVVNKLGIATTPAASTSFYNLGNITGGTTAYGNFTQASVRSDVTNVAYGNRVLINTQATPFTLQSLIYHDASLQTIGAGSSITTQTGFNAGSTLVGATNNYGFRGSIPAGTGNYNIYVDGTAPIFAAGNFLLGSTTPTAGAPKLDVTGSIGSTGLTANRALYSNANKVLTSSAVTDTELSYVSGVTSAIQTQLNAKGGVSTVSVTTANGVSGTVATATTTPAITLTLGAITPTSVTASGTVTGSNLSGTNTGDNATNTTSNTYADGKVQNSLTASTTLAPSVTAVNTGLATKQATLVSGTNIRTIEGNTLLGSTNIDLTKTDVGLSNVDNTSDVSKPVSTLQQAAIDLMIPLTQRAANNGVATLDGSGKVPLSQLPVGGDVYKGTWNASTNSPTLIDGTGTAGWYYIVNAPGTQNLGSGSITYANGDKVAYNGTIWQKVPTYQAVTSVNGQTGTVVLTTTDISEGTNKYYTDPRVSANTDVAANTSARHAAVTIGTANGLSLSTQSLSLGLSSTSTTGALSSTDWNTFNGKQAAGTYVNSVSGTTNRITSTGGVTPVLDISSSYAGQTSITTLGTIGTGVWNGNAINDTYISSATNWNNAYTNRITSLTTTGSSGASTLTGNVLNVPNYTLSGLGGQSQLSGTGFVKATGTTISYDNSTYEPAFSKNTGFNLALGTTGGTVAEGNDTRIVNGQTAFGWGDHSLAGYQLASNLQANLTSSSTKYPSVDAVNTGLATKQATLVSGTNIKTVGGTTLLGSGDIPFPAATPSNLALGTTTTSTQPITNSNGTGFTLPSATTSLAGLLGAADKTKIDGIATGATANQTDAYLLSRANHTGTQLASTISDFQTSVTNNASVLANTAKVSNATHTGDVIGSTTLTIANSAVTFAKIQDVASGTLIGRGAVGTGDVGSVTLGTGLALNSSNVLSATNTNSGTVTLFSKTDGFGITSSVSNPTTTPNITIAVDTTLLATKANTKTLAQTQTALNLKANLASPAFTGTVTGITAAMVGAPSGSGTSTGTNTGDQTTITGNAGTATTLQTSRTIGIITGDATSAGSTFNGSANNTNAITVTKINGTSLAGLSTGLLKNTTTTGVPSIAVAGTDYALPNSNTTGSAATLTTGRTIGITGDVTYTSPSFNGSANVTAAATVTRINGTSLAGLGTGILKNTTATGVPSIAVAADFPTLNQNTTGNAATVTNGVYTTRTISTGNGLTGGGDLSANRTLTADTSILATKANTNTLAQSQTRFNLKANLSGGNTFSGTQTLTGNLVANAIELTGFNSAINFENVFALQNDDTNSLFRLYDFTTSASRMNIYHNGNVDLFGKVKTDSSFLAGTITPSSTVKARFMASEAIVDHAHYGFLDNSRIDYSGIGSQARAAFNDNSTYYGTANSDHAHSYQAYPHYNSSGILNRMSGFWMQPDVTAGTITDLTEFEASEPLGTGGIVNLYGLKIADLTRGTNNWSIYTGAAPSYFNGNLTANNFNTKASGGYVLGNNYYAKGTFYSNTSQGVRLGYNSTTGNGMIMPIEGIGSGLDLVTYDAGSFSAKATLLNDGSFRVFKAPSNANDVVRKAELDLSGTVTNVSSANADISVATGTTTPILTLNSGTAANQIVKRDANGSISSSYNTSTGGLSTAIITSTSGSTLGANQHTILADATSGTITYTLPTAASISGRILVIKKIDASINTVTIDGNGTETIDGALTSVLSLQWKFIQIQSNGTNWFIIGQN